MIIRKKFSRNTVYEYIFNVNAPESKIFQVIFRNDFFLLIFVIKYNIIKQNKKCTTIKLTNFSPFFLLEN